MGLDASVMCNCFVEGKTSPPPFPREWLEIDDEGHLALLPEYESNELFNQQYEWEKNCCEHPWMDYAFENISNWGGYRLFQKALEDIDWEHFPVLQAELPNANGGTTSSRASARALQELEFFCVWGIIKQQSVLVNSATAEVLYEHIAAYNGIFLWAGSQGFEAGVSEDDFFAIDTKSKRDLFRAKRVRQFNLNGEPISGDSPELWWLDLETGASFDAGIPISGKQIPWEDGSWEAPNGQRRYEYPAEFHVDQQTQQTSDFEYVTNALRIVFAASVTTGNPVRWS
jgi:hypothetical protein